MLVCKKDFLQFKKGDKLPPKLDKKIIITLIKDGYAEDDGNVNARVAEYIARTKDNPKKNYYRKIRKIKK
jgi:hypothetical protein